MSYEIPTQIKYKEKIAFGLTISQLALAILFGGSAFYLIFKSPIPMPFNWALGGTIVILGVGFTFFELHKHIINFLDWISVRKIRLKTEKILSVLGVSTINENHFIANGREIAVLEVYSNNYAIKNKDEREIIIKVFRKLLQAIDFPTQYYIKTEKLSVDKYFIELFNRVQSISKRNQKSIYSKNCESLQQHLKQVINQNKIINRKFYIIIPKTYNLEIQTKVVSDKINSLGLLQRRVKGKELGELLINFVQPETKEVYLKNRLNYLQSEKKCYRIIEAFDYPREVEAGFLDRIISLGGDFDISIHITPYQIDNMMINLNKQLQSQRADLYGEKLKGRINPALEVKYEDTQKVLRELQRGQDKLFDVSLYINCRGKNKEELELLTVSVRTELNGVMIRSKIPKFRQIQGLRSVAPIGRDNLNAKRNITTSALSAFFPFTSKFLEVDSTGIWFGQNKNNIPLIIDPFKFSNPNGVILATSGAGKSYLAKLLISRHLLNNTQVFIIDPQGEYTPLVKRFKGQIIDLNTKSDSIINPLDLMDKTYEEKRLFLMDLMNIILGNTTSLHQKPIIDEAINKAYEQKGISDDPETWDNDPPILGDVLREVQAMKGKGSDIIENSVLSLENKLKIYVTGVFKFLNRDTNLKINKKLICFNIQKLPRQVHPIMMFLIMDFVYTTMQKNLNRKILVIDEAWKLLARAEEANYILEIVKTCRKFNLGLLLINQEVEDLINSNAGGSVLANSSYTILLKQKPSVIKDLVKIFNLSEYERDFLLTANLGQGILRTEKDQTELNVIASSAEHKFITTNADEKLKQKEE